MRYILRRLARGALILLAVSLLTFLFTLLMPGNHFEVTMAGTKIAPARIAELTRLYGFDRPVAAQYLSWLGRVVRLDFGDSLQYGKPVTAVISDFLPPTLLVGGFAFVLELVFGITLGGIAASRRNGAGDLGISALTLAVVCLPTFLLCLGGQVLFAIRLRLLPLSGLHTPGASGLSDLLLHLALPCLVLALGEGARFSRYVKDAVRRALSGDYMLLARMKGLSRRQALLRHALPCALPALLTYLGLSLPYLFAGSVVAESVFAVPGLGMAAYQAVLQRDYPLLMGITMVVSAAAVTGSLLADLACALADKRIRTGGGKV